MCEWVGSVLLKQPSNEQILGAICLTDPLKQPLLKENLTTGRYCDTKWHKGKNRQTNITETNPCTENGFSRMVTTRTVNKLYHMSSSSFTLILIAEALTSKNP